jgi:type IV pilus assembly protein PilA
MGDAPRSRGLEQRSGQFMTQRRNYMFKLGDRLRQRLHREEGFTLIELLVVIAIIGILLAIAVPSYIGFTARAHQASVSSNLRQAIPSAEAYYADNGNYLGLVTGAPAAGATQASGLFVYDSGLSPQVSVVPTPTANCYVLKATDGTNTAYVKGPGGTIVYNPAAAAVPTCP